MIKKSFSLAYKVNFFSRFSNLLSAGIPFTQALSFMVEKERVPWRKKHLQKILHSVTQGRSISISFTIKPFLIDDGLLNVLRNAEISGTLTKSFVLLLVEFEARLESRRRVLGALAYPLIVCLCSVLLAAFLYVFVFPQILPMLISSGVSLPLSTRLLISGFEFLEMYGLLSIAIVVIFGVSAFVLHGHVARVRTFLESLTLRLPVVGSLIKAGKTVQFSRSLALCLESGNTLVESLVHMHTHEQDMFFKNAYMQIAEHVRKGRRLSSVLPVEVFPAEIAQFVSIGEESGSLASSLRDVAHMIEEELKGLQKTLFSLIEPVMMIFLGIIVGCIALSLVVPMYSLTNI